MRLVGYRNKSFQGTHRMFPDAAEPRHSSPRQIGIHHEPLCAVCVVLRYLHSVSASQRRFPRDSRMECTRWGHCYFPRLNITYIWESASWYHEGHECEVTERTSIGKCDVILLCLLLIEEKFSGCKMDP